MDGGFPPIPFLEKTMLRVLCLTAVASAAVFVPVEDASAQGLRRRGMRARIVRRQSMQTQQVLPQAQPETRQAVMPNGWQPVQNAQQFVPQQIQQVVPNPTRIITSDGRQIVQDRLVQQGGRIIQGSRAVQSGWIEDGVNQVGTEIIGNASGALIGAAGGLAEGILRSIVPFR